MPAEGQMAAIEYSIKLRIEHEKAVFTGAMVEGAVIATINYKFDILSVTIKEEFMTKEHKALVEDLIPAAIKKANDNLSTTNSQHSQAIIDFCTGWMIKEFPDKLKTVVPDSLDNKEEGEQFN